MAKTIIHPEALFQAQTRKSRARAMENTNEFRNRAVRGMVTNLLEEDTLVPHARDEERNEAIETRRRRFWRRLATLMMVQHRRQERQNEKLEDRKVEENDH